MELGEGVRRTIAMSGTDGLTGVTTVVDTGKPISVPVGDVTLGRVFNVLGEPIDGGDPIKEDVQRYSIHKDAPKYDDLNTTSEVLETGIKVIDLLEPYLRGGKVGQIGRASCRERV